MPLKPWKKIERQTIHTNDYWSYEVDTFKIEGGHTGKYHYVHTLGSSMIIPVTSDKKIILVNQYRYLYQKESLEFPCGGVEKKLSFRENAIKELREETGFSAQNIIYCGEFCPFSGASDEMCQVFIGTELEYAPLKMDPTEEFEIIYKSKDQIDELIGSNFIFDGMSIAAWTLAQNKLKKILNANEI